MKMCDNELICSDQILRGLFEVNCKMNLFIGVSVLCNCNSPCCSSYNHWKKYIR